MLCLQSACLAVVWCAMALLGTLYALLAFSLLGAGVVPLVLAVILVTAAVELVIIRRLLRCETPVRIPLSSIISFSSWITPDLCHPLAASVTNCLSGVSRVRGQSLNQVVINWMVNADLDTNVGKINQFRCKNIFPSS